MEHHTPSSCCTSNALFRVKIARTSEFNFIHILTSHTRTSIAASADTSMAQQQQDNYTVASLFGCGTLRSFVDVKRVC